MPEIKDAVKNLADVMTARFTPPEFWPGCEVMSVSDKNEYTTDNGWIEAIVGPHGQQRVRYLGFPANVGTANFIDVEFFPLHKLYRVFGPGFGGTSVIGGIDTTRVSKVYEPDLSGTVMYTDTGGTAYFTGRVDIDTGSNTAGLRIRGLAETTEIADFYVDANGALIISLTAGSDAAQYIDLRTEDDNYGLILRESDGTGTSTFANFYVVDAAVDYINIAINAVAGTPGIIITDNDALGIGTFTIPHGGIGGAKLAIEGTDSSAASGPHIQATTATDDYPLYQFLAYAHDNIQFLFDAYYNGTIFGSSDAGSNFRLLKNSDTFVIGGEWGIAQGSSVSFDQLISFSQTATVVNEQGLDRDFRVEGDTDANLLFADAGNGRVGIGTGSPASKLHSYDSIGGALHNWVYDGLDGTSRTIIADGTGDVLYVCRVNVVLRDSAGSTNGGATNIQNGSSANITVGGNTVTFAVSAGGALTVSRTAGTDTIKINVSVVWL